MQLFADATGYFPLALLLVFLAVALLASAFWVWMLVDSITNRTLDSTERLI